jgi:antitoxin VapB
MVYINGIYQGDTVKKTGKPARRRKKTPSATVSQADTGFCVAKLFMNGRSQALRLPKELRYKGNSVSLKKVPGGVLIISDEDRRNALMRAYGSIPDFPEIERLPNQERPELDHLFD